MMDNKGCPKCGARVDEAATRVSNLCGSHLIYFKCGGAIKEDGSFIGGHKCPYNQLKNESLATMEERLATCKQFLQVEKARMVMEEDWCSRHPRANQVLYMHELNNILSGVQPPLAAVDGWVDVDYSGRWWEWETYDSMNIHRDKMIGSTPVTVVVLPRKEGE